MRASGAAAAFSTSTTTPSAPSLLSTLTEGGALHEGVIASLARSGFAVVDNALPLPHGTSELVAGVEAAVPWMAPNATVFDTGAAEGRERLDKAGVLEAEPGLAGRPGAPPHSADLDAASPALAALSQDAAGLAALIAVLAGEVPGRAAGSLTALGGSGAVKAQLATHVRPVEGGGGEEARGGFPIHVDSDEVLDGRRLTVTLYGEALPPGAGGELVLYPSLDPQKPPVVVPPKPGRCVLFSACRLPHAVAPVSAPGVRRHCVSIWLGVRARGVPPPPPPKPAGVVLRAVRESGLSRPAVRAAILGEPDCRRLLARLRLGRAWDTSLGRAHPPSPALDAARARAATERAAIAAAFEAVPGFDWRAEGLGEEEGDPQPQWF